jgi:hypothetical protein
MYHRLVLFIKPVSCFYNNYYHYSTIWNNNQATRTSYLVSVTERPFPKALFFYEFLRLPDDGQPPLKWVPGLSRG